MANTAKQSTGAKRGRPKGSSSKTSGGKKRTSTAKISARQKRINDLVLAIILVAVGAFFIIAMQTAVAGAVGKGIRDILMGLFGNTAYVLPYYFIVYSFLLFIGKAGKTGKVYSTLFLVSFFLLICILYAVSALGNAEALTFSWDWAKDSFSLGQLGKGGGVIGMSIGLILVKLFGQVGSYIITLALMAIMILVVANEPFGFMMDKWKLFQMERAKIQAEQAISREEYERKRDEEMAQYKQDMEFLQELNGLPETDPSSELGKKGKILGYMKSDDEALFGKNKEFSNLDVSVIPNIETGKEEAFVAEPTEEITVIPDIPPKKEKIDSKELAYQTKALEQEITQNSQVGTEKTIEETAYIMPSIDLLKKNVRSGKGNEREDLLAKAALLEQTLQNFNVNAKVLQVSKGPAVTRYEIQPAVGVKVNSIVRLADDIALNLEARSIRMEAPIPGKAAVGIEVENNKIHAVMLREVVESDVFKNSLSKITFAVGTDISGNPVVADLKEMPHLLIAGSTGSGKSVCINSIIISLLYKAKPDEVKIILIDPKVVELSNYNGIPHLLIPVVNEPSKAAVALNWAVSEMNDRYRKFAQEGVKDLASYNRKVEIKGEEKLPQIVIIIDELADLMMAAPQQVEDAICRLAQMARAAGMHLIVATQRPSVDIITGVIKANIPSRIAFAVSSQIDSRTILDMAGAERLVGKGDMLFNPIGKAKPLRVQGTLVSDEEVEQVIAFVKSQGHEQEFSQDLMHTIETSKKEVYEEDGDELLRDAIETVVLAEQASVSMLQRKFRIGYNRAARLVDMMEERGIVGPSDGSRPRRVLLSKQQLDALDGAAEEVMQEENGSSMEMARDSEEQGVSEEA